MSRLCRSSFDELRMSGSRDGRSVPVVVQTPMRILRRLGPSLTASLAWHAVVLLIVIVVGRPTGGSHVPIAPLSPSTNARVVWRPEPGPVGGGGGGGNLTPAPSRPAKAPGHDPVSVLLSKPPNLAAPESSLE